MGNLKRKKGAERKTGKKKEESKGEREGGRGRKEEPNS